MVRFILNDGPVMAMGSTNPQVTDDGFAFPRLGGRVDAR